MPDSKPIESLPNTSGITIKRLKSLDIFSFFDLINYFPFRYEDYSLVSPIIEIQPGEIVTVIGEITDAKFRITRNGLKLQVFKMRDSTGEVEFGFFNQPYLLRLLKIGMRLSISGVVEQFGNKRTIAPKEYEILNDDNKTLKHTGRIVPVYPQTRGLSSKTIREKMMIALSQCEEYNLEILPKKIVYFNDLINGYDAYNKIHFPDSLKSADDAKRRLAFDEMFLIQLSSLIIKQKWDQEKVGHIFLDKIIYQKKIIDLIQNLPFKLTKSQLNVWKEIYDDLVKIKPMNRLLQGEVGSGKTIVAGLGCYFSFLNGFKSLIMAPTEILATQHFKSIQKIFEFLDVKDRPVISLVTGSQILINNKEKNKKADITIGTHALLGKKVKSDKIGFVAIDEQHRFGVFQRAALKQKGINPHLLSMTATPIPRTVVLTLNGELDMSVMTDLPHGRKPVKTHFVPPFKRNDGYRWIGEQIKKNNAQVFVVCPLIEESTGETTKTVKAAKKEFENLSKIFSNFKLGLLHGKMKATEKNKIMTDFRSRKFDILVTTSVVEVGVDIPGATIMVIEGAERFGLAQLHQLRGRVGRNDKQSYCFLFTDKTDPVIIKRLGFFSKTNLGTILAEEDLKVRGPGEIFGHKQHGFTDLKIASLTDYELVKSTKKAAEYFITHYKLGDFPEIKRRISSTKSEDISKD